MAAGSMSGSSPWILTTISAVFGGGDFGHAIGSGEMVGARHAHAGAEVSAAFEHSLVVGGNDNAGEIARLRKHVQTHAAAWS